MQVQYIKIITIASANSEEMSRTQSVKIQICLWSKILGFPVIIYFHMVDLLEAVKYEAFIVP